MIRAVIVADEARARRSLAAQAVGTGHVEVVGEAEDAVSGLRLCARPDVDVTFIELRPAGLDGLTLARQLASLPEPPLLVFVTDCSECAVAAFGLHAADYLLKPLEPGRVAEAVRHLERRVSERRAAAALDAVFSSPEERLPVRDRKRDVARLLARDEIVAVLRRGRRTWIHTADAEYPTYYSLSRVVSWLGETRFLRASREAVVNMGAVEEILHYGDRLYQLRLRDRRGTVVKVSRSGARLLTSLLKPCVKNPGCLRFHPGEPVQTGNPTARDGGGFP